MFSRLLNNVCVNVHSSVHAQHHKCVTVFWGSGVFDVWLLSLSTHDISQKNVFVLASKHKAAFITGLVSDIKVESFHHDAVCIHDVWHSVVLPSINVTFRIANVIP